MSTPMSRDVAERLRDVGGAALVDHVERLIAVAQDGLAGTLRAAYVVGSVASGDARGPASDLDLLLVTPRRWDAATLRSMGERLVEAAAAGPMRGVEAVLYRTDILAAPAYPLVWELNVNGGRGLPRLVATDGGEAFWFLLDVAAARQHALVVLGPPVEAIVAAVPDALVLDALRDSVRWHARRGGSSPDAVLNACRAWYWNEQRSWPSKTAAGVWLVEHRSGPPVVEAALTARRGGRDDALHVGQVRAFLEVVARRLGDG